MHLHSPAFDTVDAVDGVNSGTRAAALEERAFAACAFDLVTCLPLSREFRSPPASLYLRFYRQNVLTSGQYTECPVIVSGRDEPATIKFVTYR
jgi:hypothetical protein